MVRRMSAQQARDNFGELLDSVFHTSEPVIVEKRGKPAAVVISPEDFERLGELRRERAWRLIDELRARNVDKDPDEIYAIVTAEVEAYRREKREERERPRPGAD